MEVQSEMLLQRKISIKRPSIKIQCPPLKNEQQTTTTIIPKKHNMHFDLPSYPPEKSG